MHHNGYKTFKALGMMLCYPHKDWSSNANELYQIIADEGLIKDGNDLQHLQQFAAQLQNRDILDVQEEYVETFDRNKSLSLHLFEHVHGESRDRGQAMADLSEIYQEAGFSLDKNELPDYLPAFLEYVSYLPKEQSIEMLQDPIKILKALGKRLAERGSDYSVILNSVVRVLGHNPEVVEKKKPFALSYEQLDKEWEEKPITFLGAEDPSAKSGGCGGGSCHCDSTEAKPEKDYKQPQ
ncbi:MAG: nitrate reductase molybdenum cofactor assembly chaperone [Alphaproteobacteria bacterium RIFCSPLOWO2_01_FULL_40_26]|nr:MAG: nitrate reductase molybdenum cofactor assembly chaperone [Alphaproteobacteria bacterium RIFCSPHIGHO2_02_FULL_40_34]OFW88774.1 MAG: nitrate reductase molybdenum cofactor assembly chaperone [Alphaproteobacteria bacterium RIFCSPHIGHO2_01_FULL_40_8]OFW94505.1 MAG: nitrate reductase molybdenum cofactor assembly chaperone [Alphaproteobacteria bacterium RIFCSPLOWO2_01_FULL_40_26]OFX10213.1 MAG: nitrate reductase molybdenum cofactor assembly chaperone [Alphaproteobacteria bacterium RIFCSPLOWO2_0